MNELVDKNKVMQILHNVCDCYNHGAKVHEALREAETSVNGLVTHTVPESIWVLREMEGLGCRARGRHEWSERQCDQIKGLKRLEYCAPCLARYLLTDTPTAEDEEQCAQAVADGRAYDVEIRDLRAEVERLRERVDKLERRKPSKPVETKRFR